MDVQRPGVGQVSSAKSSFTKSELAWMIQSAGVDLWRPAALVQGVYFLSVIIFNLRKEEARRLEFGNFQVVSIGGEEVFICYISGPTKTRRGLHVPSSRQGVLTYKKPIAPLSIDPAYNLSVFLKALK